MRVSILVATAVAMAAGGAAAARADQPVTGAPGDDIVARGKYLTTAADCMACHTNPGGAQLAGGRMMETPFGVIPSQNITPDKETGIGAWSDDDFYRALHEGIRKDGAYIYPVMPFTSYTRMTRDDAMAIKAYLFSIPPVHQPNKPNLLPFPFSIRTSLLAWRQLYFDEATYKPDPKKSDQFNRGGYLVEALEHCSMCHTARTDLGGPSAKAFEGGYVQGWYAPNITGDVREGVGGWSDQDIVAYLKTGSAPGRGVAVGPMAEAVHESLGKLTDPDLMAIAVYLKDQPPKEQDATARNSTGVAPRQEASAAYLTNCASCHQADGKGLAGQVPNLAGNLAVAAAGPETVYHAILAGLPASEGYTRMPSFAGILPNEQIADVANYVRTAWGNTAPRNATLEGVAKVRKLTQGEFSGAQPECPMPEDGLAAMKASQDPNNGIVDILKQINDVNIFTQVDAAVGKLRAAMPGIQNADIINGLYDADCPILAARTDFPLARKRWELNRLAQIAYVQLNPHKEAAQ